MSRCARLGSIAIGTMPARMIRIMAGGPSLAGVALSAGSAVQHCLVRTGGPILVDIVFASGNCDRASSAGHESDIGGDFLKLRARIATHWQKWQTIHLFDFAHH